MRPRPRLSAAVFLSRTPSLSRSLPSGADLSTPVSFARSLSLSLSRGLGSPVPSHYPHASPFLSLRRGPALLVPPSSLSPWIGKCALSHVVGFLGHDARPRAQLPFLEPHARPSPHFARLHPLSRSTHAAPSLPELRPKVRHPAPCPISSIAPCARPISPSPVLGCPPCPHGGRPI
jgi:hypothetical protein